MVAQVWVDGWPMDTVAAWSSPKWSEAIAGGCLTATWAIDVPPGWSHPVLRRGAPVEVRYGSAPVWAGALSEPVIESGEMHAMGFAQEAKRFVALASDGTAGRWVSDTTSHAVARGLGWASSVPWGPGFPSYANPVATEDTEGLNRLDTIWDAAADAAGLFWGVGADRRPYTRTRGGEPRWQAHVPADALGVADDEYVTHLVGTYKSVPGPTTTITVGNDAAAARWGRREEGVDLTARGPLPVEQAGSILDGMVAKLLPRPGYAKSLQFGSWDVATMGGTRAPLALLRAGDVIRLHGVRDEGLNPSAYHDITIGEIHHEVGPDGTHVVRVEPVGLAARDFRAVLEGTDTPNHLVA